MTRRRGYRAGDAVYLVSITPLAGELQGWDHYVVQPRDAIARVVPETSRVNPCSRVTCVTLRSATTIKSVSSRYTEIRGH
jgi:hypothetical protein